MVPPVRVEQRVHKSFLSFRRPPLAVKGRVAKVELVVNAIRTVVAV